MTLLRLFMVVVVAAADKSQEGDRNESIHTTGARVISKQELASKDGKASPELWLSILGEVYDVSNGTQYYGAGMSYSVFVGRDGSAAFVTGNFTPEAAETAVIDALTDNQLYQLDTWREFYEKEEKYPFVGVLEGAYYTAEGEPTEALLRVRKAAAEGKVIQEERKKRIAERIAQVKKEKEAREKGELDNADKDTPKAEEL
jgi:predicted heme/steroid binding protein